MNIRDVARMSGVSVTTVSRALNEPEKVKANTLQQIMTTIQQTNYVPNSSARYLKTQQSNIVCVLAKGISNPFFNNMIRIIQRSCLQYGYSMLLKHLDPEQDELDVAIEQAKEKKILGVIILGGRLNNQGNKMAELNIPVVLATSNVVKDVSEKLYSSISIDDALEADKAVNYLYSLGHRKIAIITSELMSERSIMRERLQGYRDALERLDLPYDEGLMIEAPEFTEYGGYRAFSLLQERHKEYTAVFSIADTMAIGFCRAALESGIRIPKDISVLGFDGIDATRFYYPSISTIKQPTEEMAHAAIETLHGLIQGGQNRHLVFSGSVIERESCERI